MTYEEFKTTFAVVNHPYIDGVKGIYFCGDDFYGTYTFDDFSQLVDYMVRYRDEVRKELHKK